MNTEILGVILQWVALVVLCYPLGRYIAKVYRGERTWLDFMAPLERGIYKVCSIDPDEDMDWKKFLKALLMVNLFWFFWGMLLLVFQGWLPLNPDGNPGQSPDLAFNTCISFMVNCNLQHYSGETGLSYFTQLFVIMLFQFVTAACGMAALFVGVTNCPITSLIIALELFGYSGMEYFSIVIAVSFALSGYYGLYASQKFVYSKTKTEFINRKPNP